VLLELGPDGITSLTTVETPVPRPLREVTGRLDDLVARAATDLAELAGCWVKAVLTDPSRPSSPMERLRAVWPHTIALDFRPDGAAVSTREDLRRLAQTTDPVEVCELFVAFVDRVPPSEAERIVLRDVVEQLQHAETGA
jgi:exonuclease SbcD